jgi:hypothetical protein
MTTWLEMSNVIDERLQPRSSGRAGGTRAHSVVELLAAGGREDQAAGEEQCCDQDDQSRDPCLS